MYNALRIENYRAFPSFELSELGRINLLVGENNSGKSSILEGILLFSAGADFPTSLEEVMTDRGEYRAPEGIGELEIRRLFYGRELKPSSQFSIAGEQGNISARLTVSVASSSPRSSPGGEDLSESQRKRVDSFLFVKRESNDGASQQLEFPLILCDGLALRYQVDGRSRQSINDRAMETKLVTPHSLEIEDLIELFEAVVLTPDEELVLEALQIVEPEIERIAAVRPPQSSRRRGIRGGFVVRLSESKERIPIGSMGDGIWRLLGIALSLVSVRGGILLVDEIDSGLHYSTLYDLWKLVWETANKLDIQVFATTHNSDCWTSLASLARDESMPEQEGIKIHRIERGKPASVVFSEQEMIIAAEREIEIR